MSISLYLLLLGLVAVQRLGELFLSRRNAQRAFARGGVESGRRQMPWMLLLHTLFLLGCAGEVLWLGRGFDARIGLPMLALALLAQALRAWTLAALGPFWNTRVITVPGMRAVSDGPYRFLRHPNYLAVVVEGFAIPLVHGAWITALVFSLANALLLRRRIRCEEAALSRDSDYHERMRGRPALWPRLSSGGAKG